MSNTAELKKYLIDEDDGYLLSDDNNGKTIMLSGTWGSGKTHFWQNEIEPKVTEKLKLKDKSCTYISLYGKDSLSELKKEVFIRASTENVLLSKEVSTFGFEALSSIEESGLAIGKILNAAKGLDTYRKSSKGIKRLQDGGIICFDDFERKSKEIDLNDLFGFISQLAIDMKCKVVIILNSDVFEGEEANVFKTVKEKTVNKFFYFEPTIEELFGSIYDRKDEKYKKLDNHRHDILKAINETGELNARIYIQILDNCLEWIERGYDSSTLRCLVLNTLCYVKHHFILGYPVYTEDRQPSTAYFDEVVAYNELRESSALGRYIVNQFSGENLADKILIQSKIDSFYDNAVTYISGRQQISAEEKQIILDELDESFDEYMTIIHFGYKLYVAENIEEDLYAQVSKFIKTGILSKQGKEQLL